MSQYYDEEEISTDALLTNMIVMGASLIVIAAVVIGVVSGVDNKHGSGKLENVTLDNVTVNVDALCNKTDYKDSCISTLQPVGHNAGVNAYLRTAVNATISEMTLAMQKAKADDVAGDDAVEDCVELIGLCIEDLESVIPVVGVGDARSSLSAVLSYQNTCLEGLRESRSTSDVDRGLQKSKELASIVLAIIYEYFPNDDVEAESAAAIVRRKTDEDEDDDGFSDQRLSAADRKLLQDYKKGGQIPHATVAKDGSGEYGSIGAALDAYPEGIKGRYIIHVKSGVYEENVIIAKNMSKVFMYGDGANETIISGKDVGGTAYRRATLSAIGNGFICAGIGIKIPEKSSGNSIAAVKLQSDKAAFYKCSINGTTSSIYALAHRQFFTDCEIYGVTNIIKGDAAIVIKRSKIIVKQPSAPVANIIALQARSDKRESTGFVIHGCRIEADQSYFPERLNKGVYLGMAMQKYSRTIVMESFLGDLINPEGWCSNNEYGIEAVTFAEYRNEGPGAQTNKRVNWPSYTVIANRNVALRYTAEQFIQLQKWLLGTIIGPLQAGLFS